MTPINPNWTRWIESSVKLHFHQILQVANGIKTHMSGERYDLKYFGDTHCELRMDGPRYKEISKGLFFVIVEVNILISVNMGNKTPSTVQKSNLYTMASKQGIVLNAITTPIPITKLGTSVVDTGEFMCCLTVAQTPGKRDMIETNNFGQIDTTNPIQQSAIEAHFHMECDFT